MKQFEAVLKLHKQLKQFVYLYQHTSVPFSNQNKGDFDQIEALL